MTPCKIVLNFFPPDHSMWFVTLSGPRDLSGVSLCFAFITSFLSMRNWKSGSIGWISWAIQMTGWRGLLFRCMATLCCATYGGPRRIEICATLGGQTSGAWGSISVRLPKSCHWFALGVSISCGLSYMLSVGPTLNACQMGFAPGVL